VAGARWQRHWQHWQSPALQPPRPLTSSAISVKMDRKWTGPNGHKCQLLQSVTNSRVGESGPAVRLQRPMWTNTGVFQGDTVCHPGDTVCHAIGIEMQITYLTAGEIGSRVGKPGEPADRNVCPTTERPEVGVGQCSCGVGEGLRGEGRISGEKASTFFQEIFVRKGVVSMHRPARRCASVREGFSAGR
jgi:hypothetical protein